MTDFEPDEYEPEVIRVNLKRLSPRELSIIETHTGFTARMWDSTECPMGKLSQAMAYVMLKRRNPHVNDRELWERADNTVVESVDEAVPPTK